MKSILLDQTIKKWDAVLPQIMPAYHSTPHYSTSETPNFLMLD